ncbi:MAG TPA: hypothetical protein VFE61_16210 [Candidatus Sulfotelmatobacter sp.]|nr:hypothetical protein [Candidatus Sulfotelmatobacter sp.]
MLPEKHIIDRTIRELERRGRSPMLADSDFRSDMNLRLRKVAQEIAAHETAHGQGPTQERQMVEDVANYFSVLRMIE